MFWIYWVGVNTKFTTWHIHLQAFSTANRFFNKKIDLLSRAHDISSRAHDILSRAHVWAHGRSVATVIQTTISCIRGQCSTKWGTSAAMHVLGDKFKYSVVKSFYFEIKINGMLKIIISIF